MFIYLWNSVLIFSFCVCRILCKWCRFLIWIWWICLWVRLILWFIFFSVVVLYFSKLNWCVSILCCLVFSLNSYLMMFCFILLFCVVFFGLFFFLLVRMFSNVFLELLFSGVFIEVMCLLRWSIWLMLLIGLFSCFVIFFVFGLWFSLWDNLCVVCR